MWDTCFDDFSGPSFWAAIPLLCRAFPVYYYYYYLVVDKFLWGNALPGSKNEGWLNNEYYAYLKTFFDNYKIKTRQDLRRVFINTKCSTTVY